MKLKDIAEVKSLRKGAYEFKKGDILVHILGHKVEIITNDEAREIYQSVLVRTNEVDRVYKAITENVDKLVSGSAVKTVKVFNVKELEV